jgi:hypothetical protein
MALADLMISLIDGRIQECDCPAGLVRGRGYASRLGLKLSPDGVVEEKQVSDDLGTPMEQLTAPTNKDHQVQLRHTDTRRKDGDKASHEYYLNNAGWKAVTLYSVSAAMWVFFSEFSSEFGTCTAIFGLNSLTYM